MTIHPLLVEVLTNCLTGLLLDETSKVAKNKKSARAKNRFAEKKMYSEFFLVSLRLRLKLEVAIN